MTSPENLLPLKPLVFDILLVLNEEERHGYGMAKALQERAPRGRRVLPGNLYRTLAAMTKRGLIANAPHRDRGADDDERRRYFRITEFGRRVARAEAERLSDRVDLARAQRLLAGSRSR